MSELIFFVGKGGVGKTTVSSAYSVRTAMRRPVKPVLLISTDPAHSLGDIFQIPLRDKAAKLLGGSLRVWQMNSDAMFKAFLEENRDQLVNAIERGSFFSREEISSLLDTSLPGISEMASLLAIQDAIRAKRYSSIVIDTAPFGHTLRLFSLPDQFMRILNFLEMAGDRDRILAERFGGGVQQREDAFVDGWRERLTELAASLAGAKLFLVTTPEDFALQQSVRCIRELHESNPKTQLAGIILNRVVNGRTRCPRCAASGKSSRDARSVLQKHFGSIRTFMGADPGYPIVGLDALHAFARHVFSGTALKRTGKATTVPTKTYRLAAAQWPDLTTPLSLITGKGGVGKTTVTAGLGYRSRCQSRDSVEICSVDPAPSLDEVFEMTVGDRSRPVFGDKNFRASELDSIALFRRWIAELRAGVDEATSAQVAGVHIDLSFERKLFSELLELVPPGVDEVLSVFRIVELMDSSSRKVIIDMAPTGHALELLRTPERMLAWSRLLLKSLAAHRKLALAREAAAKIAELQVRARELVRMLHTSSAARIYLVMLPELLPDRETARLLRQLETLGLSVEAIFVNRVLLGDDAANCARCRLKARWQSEVLSKLKRQFKGHDVFVVPEFEGGVAGRAGLRKLTRELWRLS